MKHLLTFLVISLCVQCPLFADANGGSKTDSVATKKSSHYQRNFLVGNLVGGAGAYFYFSDTWGAPTGNFHFKDELHDHLKMTDEISHFFAAYKLTTGSHWLFGLLGMPDEKRLKYSVIEAALITTLVEFPMDSFNPDQGFGWSDLLFDYGGVGLGILKVKYPFNLDMKMSVKKGPWNYKHKFLASTNAEFDNFIWWGTWKPKYVWLGFGYGTHRNDANIVNSDLYLGVGTTLYDVMHLFLPKVADEVKALDSYYFNLNVKL